MEKIDKEIEELKAKLKQAENRKKQIAATLREQEKKKKKAEEDRKKILVGAMYLWLEKKDASGEIGKWMIQGLDGFLTRDDERALFGLPPLKKEEKKDEPAQS